jgi:hypothetical protein
MLDANITYSGKKKSIFRGVFFMENQRKKLRLDELTVKSFVTSPKADAAKGGTWTVTIATPMLTPFLGGCDDQTVNPTEHEITRNDIPNDTILGSVVVDASLDRESTNCNCLSYHSGCYRP